MEKARCELCNRDFAHRNALSDHNRAKHKKENAISKKTLIITSAIILILLIVVFVLATKPATKASDTTPGNTANTPPADAGNVQKADLSVSGSTYVLTPSILKKDVPVEITAKPSNLPGCSRTVTIPAFRIYKTITDNDNVISFTPNQPGTFKIACGMNMYRGTFTVQ